jgi:hypothetical protein
MRHSLEVPLRLITLECLILLLALSLAAAPATDVTGQWTAQTIMGPSGAETPLPTTFTFKVEGAKLTGTVQSPRGTFEILDGKIEGDAMKFSILVTGGAKIKILYDGKVTADGIDFISHYEGSDRSDHFLAKRLPA